MVNLLGVRWREISFAKTTTGHGIPCRVGSGRLAEPGRNPSLADETAQPAHAGAEKLARLLRARLMRPTLDRRHFLGCDLRKPPARQSAHFSNPHATARLA